MMVNRMRLLNALLVLLGVGVIAFTLAITSQQASTLAQEEREKIDLWAEATRQMANADVMPGDYSLLLKVIQGNYTLPSVLTDANRFPIAMRNIPDRYLSHPDELPEFIEQLALEHEPIEIVLPSGEVNYVFYGSSEVLRGLRHYPYVQLLFIIVLTLLGFLMFRQARLAEQNRVWVGLAKETAHQLGTPISSLMGWAQYLQEENTNPELAESLALDVERLQRVAQRFSKIGAKPQLEDTDLQGTLEQSIAYISPRIPHRVMLSFLAPSFSMAVPHNSILIQWVIENLVRNSVDALGRRGSINVELHYTPNLAIVDCTDTGKGMGKRARRMVFNPGYSTKQRGWGLGLSLAKRIVKQYHHGRIYVLQSEPGKGTTFRIELRAVPYSKIKLQGEL